VTTLHPEDLLFAAVLILAIVTIGFALAQLGPGILWRARFAARRARELAGQRWDRLVDRLFGRPDIVVEQKSLPFFLMVKMPEAEYLGVVTFRRFIEGRARGRKKVRVRAHVRMQPGEEIPYPSDVRTVGLSSLMLTHADSLDDVARQVAEYVMRIRIRRFGADWKPTLTPDA
jgi:hypothetical protein